MNSPGFSLLSSLFFREFYVSVMFGSSWNDFVRKTGTVRAFQIFVAKKGISADLINFALWRIYVILVNFADALICESNRVLNSEWNLVEIGT